MGRVRKATFHPLKVLRPTKSPRWPKRCVVVRVCVCAVGRARAASVVRRVQAARVARVRRQHRISVEGDAVAEPVTTLDELVSR